MSYFFHSFFHKINNFLRHPERSRGIPLNNSPKPTITNQTPALFLLNPYFPNCHPQLDWGSSLNQRFWILGQAGNDKTEVLTIIFCHPQLDWGSSLNQRFWIPNQVGNDSCVLFFVK